MRDSLLFPLVVRIDNYLSAHNCVCDGAIVRRFNCHRWNISITLDARHLGVNEKNKDSGEIQT